MKKKTNEAKALRSSHYIKTERNDEGDHAPFCCNEEEMKKKKKKNWTYLIFLLCLRSFFNQRANVSIGSEAAVESWCDLVWWVD